MVDLPTTEEVPPILLNKSLSVCMKLSPTVTPVADPEIVVTVATVSTVVCQTLLVPFGMIRFVVPVPSRDRLEVAAVVRVSSFRAVKRDCCASPFDKNNPFAFVICPYKLLYE